MEIWAGVYHNPVELLPACASDFIRVPVWPLYSNSEVKKEPERTKTYTSPLPLASFGYEVLWVLAK